MKKQLLLILLAMVGMSYSSISYAQIANEIEGTYTGTLIVTVTNGEPVLIDQDITITATGNEEITLEIKDFTFEMGAIPVPSLDLAVEGIAITKEGEEYTFEGNAEIDINIGPLLPATVSGKIDARGTMTLSLSIPDIVDVEFKDGRRPGIADEIAKDYDGTLEISSAGAAPTTIDHTVTIIASAEKEISLEIKGLTLSMGGANLENIDLVATGITVSQGNNEYLITGSPNIAIPGMGVLPFTLDGKVDSDNELSFTLAAPGGLIEVKFSQGDGTNIPYIESSDFAIYPTTTYDVINIQGINNNSKYSIYNVAGSLVKTGTANSTINVANFPKGIYILQIEGNIAKFIKK